MLLHLTDILARFHKSAREQAFPFSERWQGWIVSGILREIKRFVKVAQTRIPVAGREGWPGWMAMGSIVVAAWREMIELMIHAGQTG